MPNNPDFSVSTAEEFFGFTATLESLNEQYRKWALLEHPDVSKAEDAVARFQKLQQFYEIAKARHDKGIYGDLDALLTPIIVPTKNHGDFTLHIKKPTGVAPFNWYQGVNSNNQEIILKVIKAPRDNDLFEAELTVLRKCYASQLFTNGSNSRLLLPTLTAAFSNRTHEGTQAVHVFDLGKEKGFSLAEVRAKYQNNLPLEHIIWMMNRCISALEIPHSEGFVYGGFIPENITVYPKTHGATLWNWETAVRAGTALVITASTASSVVYPDFVFAKTPATQGLDIMMLAGLFYYLAAIDPTDATLPREWYSTYGKTHDQQRGLTRLEGLMRYYYRTQDLQKTFKAVQFFHELKAAAQLIFGSPKFVEFTM